MNGSETYAAAKRAGASEADAVKAAQQADLRDMRARTRAAKTAYQGDKTTTDNEGA